MSKDISMPMGKDQPAATVRYEDYFDGYRAGVEAMRDACKREGSYWFTYYENHFDTIASRLLEERKR